MKKLLFTSMILFTVKLLVAQTIFYFDFGPNDGSNGNNTSNPDANGHYWNNINDPYVVNNPTYNLVDESNSNTSLVLKVTSNFDYNGINHGGLLAPDPAFLGDFAIATATQDYFFTTSNATIEISGMPAGDSNGYVFSFFGTRETTLKRISTYELTGTAVFSGDLQTSGENIGEDGMYDGNDNTILVSDPVYADNDGKIFLKLIVEEGGFAYLGIMKMEYAGTLPVEINHFSAEPMENYVQLHWSTATETANTGFEVQRSRDGLYWEKIGFEKGRSTGNSGAGYSFRDTEPFAGKNYYRLRSVDEDGQFKLSDMVSAYVKPAFGKGELSVYPNPATTQATVNLPAGTHSLKLTDQYGKYIRTIELNLSNNTNQQLSINTQDLLPGLYILESTGDYGRTSKKFIVK